MAKQDLQLFLPKSGKQSMEYPWIQYNTKLLLSIEIVIQTAYSHQIESSETTNGWLKDIFTIKSASILRYPQ